MNDDVCIRKGAFDRRFHVGGDCMALREGQTAVEIQVQLDDTDLAGLAGAQMVHALNLCMSKRDLFDAFAVLGGQLVVHE